jgi:hypothetical protein
LIAAAVFADASDILTVTQQDDHFDPRPFQRPMKPRTAGAPSATDRGTTIGRGKHPPFRQRFSQRGHILRKSYNPERDEYLQWYVVEM